MSTLARTSCTTSFAIELPPDNVQAGPARLYWTCSAAPSASWPPRGQRRGGGDRGGDGYERAIEQWRCSWCSLPFPLALLSNFGCESGDDLVPAFFVVLVLRD